jgi:hypothetical protein
VHIELTEMLRCPEPHADGFMVLSTGEMLGRMVRSGIAGCSICHREYAIKDGVVDFTGDVRRETGDVSAPLPTSPVSRIPSPDASTLQALLDLSGPGGYVVLLGAAARHAVGLAALMSGVHFVGVNAPPDVEELPVLSLVRSAAAIPLRQTIARGVVVGADVARAPWLVEARRVLLPGRRWVVESESVELPEGISKLAAGQGLSVGEKR